MRAFVGLALAVALAACRSTIAISLPATSARPDVVLTAYLNALVAADCATTRALSTSTAVRGNGDLCGVVRVTGFRFDGPPATPSGDEVVFATSIHTFGGDETLRDGEHTWFYTLTRQPDGAWRISGGGSGP